MSRFRIGEVGARNPAARYASAFVEDPSTT
jgi:hypothetical protein